MADGSTTRHKWYADRYADRYAFDKNRYRVKECPCGKNNADGKFAPFDGHDRYGYCHSCGKSFFPDRGAPTDRPYANTLRARNAPQRAVNAPQAALPPLPKEWLVESMRDLERNRLVMYLKSILPMDTVRNLIQAYRIGTNNQRWEGASVLWHIDRYRMIRAGKVTLYDPMTGRRIKEPYQHTTWIHKLKGAPEGYRLMECFFGEHLLADRSRPVAVAEGERTAIVMAAKMPEYIWIASGGKGNLTGEKLKALHGRDVILFPDSGKGYAEWKAIAKELRPFVKSIRVDELVQSHSNGRENLDILDLIDVRQERNARREAAKIASPITDSERHWVRKIFPAAWGGDRLTQRELITAILYHIRRNYALSDRMRPPTFDEVKEAEGIADGLIRRGAIVKNDRFYHSFEYGRYGMNV